MNARTKHILGLIAAGAIAILISALAARDAHALEPGQQYCRGDVCVIKAQTQLFGETLYYLDQQIAREGTGNLLAYKRELRSQLHENFTDAELFVMWNNAAARELIQTDTPGAWAIMSEVMHDLAYQHRFEPGRTYKLDY